MLSWASMGALGGLRYDDLDVLDGGPSILAQAFSQPRRRGRRRTSTGSPALPTAGR
jgi:hypothetical protein